MSALPYIEKITMTERTRDVDVELARLVGIAVGVAYDAVVADRELCPAGRGTRVREQGVTLPDELWVRPRHWTSLLWTVHL